MADQTQWIGGVLSLARIAFDTTMRSMDIVPQQAEKALELAMNNTQMVQEETRKAFASWIENVNNARKVYINAVEEGLTNLERQFSQEGKKSK